MGPRKYYVIETAVLGGAALGVLVALILPANTYHFHTVSMNLYQNGTADFSTDITALVRSLGIASLGTMLVGVFVGTALGLTYTQKGKGRSVYDQTVLRRFVNEYQTEKGTRFELTEEGLQFLKEYAYLENENVKPQAVTRQGA